jgi:hypothetical protein
MKLQTHLKVDDVSQIVLVKKASPEELEEAAENGSPLKTQERVPFRDLY